jgi:hypothetical protein
MKGEISEQGRLGDDLGEDLLWGIDAIGGAINKPTGKPRIY